MDTENKNDKVAEKAQPKSRNKFNKEKVIKWLHFFIEGENLLWSIAFVVYFCFHSFFENIISKYFVEPFFSTFQDTVITSLLTIAVGLIVITKPLLRLYHNYEKGDSISVSSFYPWGLLLLLYIYYRAGDVWVFYGIFGCEHVFYSDIFFLIFIAVITSKISFKKRTEEPQKNNAFSIDNPITNTGEDLLGRAPFAESLANRVFDTPTTNGAFTVGVVASWGYGKTSFLNIMKDCLSRKGAIVINFSPWLYGEDNNLTKAFFAELNKYLKVYNRALSEKLILYAELLESAEVPYMKFFSKLLKQGYKQSLDSLRCDLEKALKAITTPIVVIIDDLDRLGAKEIIEVMKIIRNSANFANIRFVAAYDRDYVANAIRSLTAPENYLEKIFQVEYVLPNFDRNKLSEYLKEQLSFVEEQEELGKCLTSGNFAIEELTNLRDVKRFVNMFQMVYQQLKGEIVLVDLMNLIILKQKYIFVYNLLAKYNRRFLVPKSEMNYMLYQKDIHYTDKTKIDIIAEWNSYLKEYDANSHKTDIIRLLEKLFPSSSNEESNIKNISNMNSIERYFHDALLDEDYSSQKFNELWEKNYNEIIKEIKDNTPTKASSLIKQMFNYNITDKDKYKKIVRAIFYLGKILKTYSFINKNYVTRLLEKNIIEDDFEHYEFIYKTMVENGPSKFVFEYLFFIEDSSTEWPLKYLSLDDSRNIRLILLEEAIKENSTFEDVYFYISQLRIKKEIILPQMPSLKNKKYELDNKAKNIFINYANKHKMEVIIGLIEKSGDKYLISNMAEYIWDYWDAYENFVKSIEPQNEQVKEYLRFFEKQKIDNFKYAVQFDFIHIKVPNDTKIID